MRRGTSNLKLPSWPIKRILDNEQAYAKSIERRQTRLHANAPLSQVSELVSQLHSLRQQRQETATKRNSLADQAKKLAMASKMKDQLTNEGLRKTAKAVKEQMASVEKSISQVEGELECILDSIPNLIAPDTSEIPNEDGYKIVDYLNLSIEERLGLEKAGKQKDRDHVNIGTRLKILDIEAGSRVSGSGFYYLMNGGALLEHALVQYALKKCQDAGFSIVSPPTVVRQQFSEACGFRPRDDTDVTQMYSVSGGDGEPPVCLVGTAEISLAGQNAHRTVTGVTKHAGVCRSYRAEAGARGADTRGLYRVHEFTKVEMFVWTDSDDIEASQSVLRSLVEIQKDIVKDLELPARVIKLAPNDLGAPAYQKFDIEVWMPGRGKWGEISSASNCTDFQSRRLHTVNQDGVHVHTLNGTALAVPRIILALIENNWDPESQSIKLPKVLQPYLGTEAISAQ